MFDGLDASPKYYICNPFTRQWQLLSKPPPRAVSLTPQNKISLTVNVFGLSCEEEKDQWKNKSNKSKNSVLIVFYCYDNRFNAVIFRSETGKWSQLSIISCPWRLRRSFFPQNTVSINGRFYWLDTSYKPQGVVAFDRDDLNKCRFINLPHVDVISADADIESKVFLGEFRNRLRLGKVVLRKNIEGELENIWTVWELQINDDEEDEEEERTNKCWSLVHEKVCSAIFPSEGGEIWYWC